MFTFQFCFNFCLIVNLITNKIKGVEIQTLWMTKPEPKNKKVIFKREIFKRLSWVRFWDD